MGGIGSGRISSRASVETSRAVRLASLYPAIRSVYATATPSEGRLEWLGQGRSVQTLHFTLSAGAPGILVLTLRPGSRDWFTIEPILLSSTRQPRGGQRWWIGCPACRCRTSALFLQERRWCCRRCANLTYQSSRDSDKRLGPLLREIEHAWLTRIPAGLDFDIPSTSGKGNLLQDVLADLGATRDLRLRLKAGRLALTRLLHGRPLYRGA